MKTGTRERRASPADTSAKRPAAASARKAKGGKGAAGRELTPAQLAGRERITLPDGRWYHVCWDEEGNLITDPEVCGIWEVGEDGRAVTWISQARLANMLDVTPRWLQKLDAKGLPARGFRETCEYPLPHSIVWWIAYKRMGAKGPVQHLSMARAWAEHDREQAIAEAEIDYKMATDPEYRRYMERFEAENEGGAEL